MNKILSLLVLFAAVSCGESKLKIQKNLLKENKSGLSSWVDPELVKVQEQKRLLQGIRFLCSNQPAASKFYLFSGAATATQWGSSFSLQDPEKSLVLQDLRVESLLQSSPTSMRFLLNAESGSEGRKLFEVVLRFRERATELMPIAEVPALPRLLQVLLKKHSFLSRTQVAVNSEAKEIVIPTFKLGMANISFEDRKTLNLEGVSSETLLMPQWGAELRTLVGLEYQTNANQFALLKAKWDVAGKLLKKELILPRSKTGLGFVAIAKVEGAYVALSEGTQEFEMLRISSQGTLAWESIPKKGNEEILQLETTTHGLSFVLRNQAGAFVRILANADVSLSQSLILPQEVLPFSVERIWAQGEHLLYVLNQNEERRVYRFTPGDRPRPVSRRECYSPVVFFEGEE